MNILQQQRQRAKSIQEHVARAKAYLRRGDFVKSMESAEFAFSQRKGARLIGKDKIETQYALEEYCLEFNAHQKILEFLDSIKVKVRPFLVYGEGKEDQVKQRLEILRQRLILLEEENQRRTDAEAEKRKNNLLGLGRDSLESKKFPMGRSYLRKVVEEFAEDQDVLVQAGRLFLKYDFPVDALDVLEEAIQRFPNNSEAYSLAARALRLERRFEDAEALYQAALKQFGTHPMTLLNMSKMYLEWRKKDQAFETAKQAFEADPKLEEAREIMEKTA